MGTNDIPQLDISWDELEKQAQEFRKNHLIEISRLGPVKSGTINPEYLTRSVDLTINGLGYTLTIDNSGLNMAGNTWATTHGRSVAEKYHVSVYVLGEALDSIFKPYHDAMRATIQTSAPSDENEIRRITDQ